MGLIYRKGKEKLNYLEEKPEVWRARQLLYPKVTETMLIEEISQSQGVPKTQTKAVIEALKNRLQHYMEIGHLVSLGSFGSFKPVFNAKVAETKDELTAEKVKVVKIAFFPGGDFKQMLHSMSIESTEQAFLDEDEPE